MATPRGGRATKAEKRGGLDFHSLARGTDKSYSTGYLVNLDQHTLGLVGHNYKKSNFDLGLTSLITHTKRMFDQVESYSERVVEQFCFGSTNIQLNPNYRSGHTQKMKTLGIPRVFSVP